jgi:hypothetical protein
MGRGRESASGRKSSLQVGGRVTAWSEPVRLLTVIFKTFVIALVPFGRFL